MSILQANKFRLSDLPSMPQVDLGVDRFLSTLIMEKEIVSNVGGFAQKLPQVIKTLGSIQPFGPRQLMVKPEGERSWSWYQLHTAININLEVNDRIRIRKVVYKVMAKLDYSRSNYFEFHVIEDFKGGDFAAGGCIQ